MKRKRKKSYPLFNSFLDEGEVIMDIVHRSLIVFYNDSAKVLFFGIFLPILGYWIFPSLALGFIIWGLVGLFGMVYHFIDYYYDVWILTNVGVIDIDRKGIFDITTTRIEYHMIEGTSYNIKGFVQTMFQFGDITIDKLGAQTSVVLKDAINPRQLERKVMQYQDQFISQKSFRDHNALKDMLSNMIAYHVQSGKVDQNNNE